MIIGVLSNALCALFFAIINVIIRSLKDVHHSLVAVFQSTGNFLLSLVVLIIYRIFINPNNFDYQLTLTEICLLILSGLVRSFGMLFFIKAFQIDKAGRVAGLNFLQIIFGYTSDVIFFSYDLHGFEILGSSIIIICSISVFMLKIYNYSDNKN